MALSDILCCFKGFVIRNMSTFTQSLKLSFIEIHRGVPIYCICYAHSHIYKVYLYSRTLPAALVIRMNLSIVFRHIHLSELILKFFSWHKIPIAKCLGLSYSAAFFLPSSWCLVFLLGESSGTYFSRCEVFLTFPTKFRAGGTTFEHSSETSEGGNIFPAITVCPFRCYISFEIY